MKSSSDMVLPASLAGGAAILSVVTGFISGVSPGMILLRGVVIAGLTLIFVLGAGWVIRRFLPELTEAQESQGDSGSAVPPSGRQVNIVMPEESPVPPGGRGPAPADGLSGNPVPGRGPASEFAEDSGIVHNSKPESSESGPAIASGGRDLDILPSLDTLELGGGTASSVDDLESEQTDSVNVSQQSEANVGGSHDPAEIAKAVKTVLKRDQQE